MRMLVLFYNVHKDLVAAIMDSPDEGLIDRPWHELPTVGDEAVVSERFPITYVELPDDFRPMITNGENGDELAVAFYDVPA